MTPLTSDEIVDLKQCIAGAVDPPGELLAQAKAFIFMPRVLTELEALREWKAASLERELKTFKRMLEE